MGPIALRIQGFHRLLECSRKRAVVLIVTLSMLRVTYRQRKRKVLPSTLEGNQMTGITRLKLNRLAARRTQQQEAKRVGVSVALWRELETGRAIPSDRVAALIERRYGVPAHQLLRLVEL
jgi:hypothetical protein